MSASHNYNETATVGGLLIAFCIYFIPWFIALVRGRNDTIAIFVVNFVLGWTGLGWIVALFWSLTKPTTRLPDASASSGEKRE